MIVVDCQCDLRDPETAQRWDQVVAADPLASGFQRAAWLTTWAHERGEGQLVPRLFVEDGELVAVVAEVHVKGASSLAGGRDVTDYRGPAVVPGRVDDVAQAWLAALDADGLTSLDLHGMPDDTGMLDALERAVATRPPWTLDGRSVEDVCPRVDLRGDDATAWLERLDGKQRQEFGRKARKLGRDLGGVELAEVLADDLAAGLDRFWSFAREAEAEKGTFFRDPKMREFFDAVIANVGVDGGLRVHELVAGGLPAASMISLVWGRTWGLYNSSFDPALGSYAPGSVLASQLATLAAQEGFEVFDFLRGDEEYKYGFGAVDRVIESARLVRG